MSTAKPIHTLSVCLLFLGFFGFAIQAVAEESRSLYVGSEGCRGCHGSEYDNFVSSAKKAKSYESIEKMQKKLSPAEFQECCKCHTTGFGEPGGFRSVEETPEMKNAGCEVCHGPGSRHAETGDPADIVVKVNLKRCDKCHKSDRVVAFGYKPMLFAGAH